MHVYNYFITVRDGTIHRLIHFSVKSLHIDQANLAVTVAIVNSNHHTRDEGYKLVSSRLASIKEERKAHHQ